MEIAFSILDFIKMDCYTGKIFMIVADTKLASQLSWIAAEGGDSCRMSEKISHHIARIASVMAYRSPRGKRPPEAEILWSHLIELFAIRRSFPILLLSLSCN
jgi:hypothetical protein